MGFYGQWNLILTLFIWSEVNVNSKNQIKSNFVVKRRVLVVFDQDIQTKQYLILSIYVFK